MATNLKPVVPPRQGGAARHDEGAPAAASSRSARSWARAATPARPTTPRPRPALVGFTKSLAQEVGSRNITVNCVAPGFIDTDMTRALPDAQREALLGRIPLGRLGARRGRRRGGRVSGEPARRLHHRRDPARQRRHVHGLTVATVRRCARRPGCPVPIWQGAMPARFPGHSGKIRRFGRTTVPAREESHGER